jgi:catechol 2,3-dioxygenase-like lactoylglutathione lyase family enzyme
MASTSPRGIDHGVILVRDLDRAAAQYRRLGFTLTPRGHHSGLGSSNHCAMFENRDYLELLGLARERGRRPFYEEFLRTREGIVGLAFRTADARAVRERLAADGFNPPQPIAFGRPVETAGVTRDARFVTTEADAKTTDGARLFFCQHETPELVWLPDALAHSNGVTGILALVVFDEDARLANTCARLTQTPLERDGDMHLLRLGAHRLEFLSPALAADRFAGDPLLGASRPALAGVRLKTADLATAERLLRAAGVAARRSSDRLTISSADALGAVLELSA